MVDETVDSSIEPRQPGNVKDQGQRVGMVKFGGIKFKSKNSDLLVEFKLP